MSLANVVLYIAVLGFVVYRRVQGKPVGSARQLFLLPVVVTVLGYQDLARTSLDTVGVVFAVAGCVLSLVLGALRGSLNKISGRDGRPWVRWGAASVAVFVVNVAAKLILDVIGVVAGGTASGATSSLVLAAGLMLAGEAGVVWLRVQAAQPTVQGDRAASPEPVQARPAIPAPRMGEAGRHAGSSVRDEASRAAVSLLRRLADGRAED
jgi:hypothetical protein